MGGLRVGTSEAIRDSALSARPYVTTLTDLHKAAHDLRTPLATVVQGIDALLEIQDDNSLRARKIFELLRRNVFWMGEVLETSIERRQLPASAIDLVTLVEDTRALVEPLLTARDQSLTIEAGGPAYVRADYGGIARVVLNLIDNASKYGPSGDSIRITIRRRGAGTVVSVIDHGPGIPAGERHAIFRAFYRTTAARRSDRPGVGLGLTVVRDNVEAHGGTVGVTRAKGATRVWFYLPSHRTAS